MSYITFNCYKIKCQWNHGHSCHWNFVVVWIMNFMTLTSCIDMELSQPWGHWQDIFPRKYIYEKSTKCQNFTYLPKKYFSRFFFFGGGANTRMPPSPAPMTSWILSILHWSNITEYPDEWCQQQIWSMFQQLDTTGLNMHTWRILYKYNNMHKSLNWQ